MAAPGMHVVFLLPFYQNAVPTCLICSILNDVAARFQIGSVIKVAESGCGISQCWLWKRLITRRTSFCNVMWWFSRLIYIQFASERTGVCIHDGSILLITIILKLYLASSSSLYIDNNNNTDILTCRSKKNHPVESSACAMRMISFHISYDYQAHVFTV